jgi:hypothetical protein
VAAQATFPADAPFSGWPGPTIEVNTAYTGTPNNDLTKLRNMVHELGHAIGFRHTNWQTNDCDNSPCQPGEYGANQIPNTPPTDAASVMNGGTATEEWAGFSQNDSLATTYLYPTMCTPSSAYIEGPGDVNSSSTCSNGYFLHGGIASSWSTDGDINQSDGSTAWISFTMQGGGHWVTANDMDGQQIAGLSDIISSSSGMWCHYPN